MAKKRKKTKSMRLSGFRISKPVLETALNAANTRVGRVLIAEALILAAGVLTRKHPVATVSAAGAEMASTTKSMAGFAGEAAVSLMQAAAEHLRGNVGTAGSAPRHGGDGDKQRGGQNGWDKLDQAAIRQAVMGEFTRKKKGKKAKAAGRH